MQRGECPAPAGVEDVAAVLTPTKLGAARTAIGYWANASDGSSGV